MRYTPLQDVRDVIRIALEARRQIERVTPAEFVQLNVGPFLFVAIQKLKALDIHPANTYYRTFRDAEIGACEDCIRRWHSAKTRKVPETAQEAVAEVEASPTFRIYTRDGHTIFKCYTGGKK